MSQTWTWKPSWAFCYACVNAYTKGHLISPSTVAWTPALIYVTNNVRGGCRLSGGNGPRDRYQEMKVPIPADSLCAAEARDFKDWASSLKILTVFLARWMHWGHSVALWGSTRIPVIHTESEDQAMVPKVGLLELLSCEMLFRMKGSTDPSLIPQIFVKSLLNAWYWASLVAQWQRIHLPKQETWIRSLVGEDPTGWRETKPTHHND